MDWTAIRLLYLSELRSALRERAVVINGILIPLLMYPLMTWVMFTAVLFVTARFESLASRVEIAGLPAEHRGILERLEEDGRTEITEVDAPTAHGAAAYREDVQDRLLAGELDAALIFEPTADAVAGNAAVWLLSNGSSDQSRTAGGRLERALSGERAAWLDRIAERHGLDDAEWQVFEVRSSNLASRREMGQFVMGQFVMGVEVRRNLGFYSASTALYPRLTARETLTLLARVNRYPAERTKSRVEEMIERFGLGEYAGVRIDKLSSGMKQKVSIARTVVHDPPVLIFDEPTVGLDVLNALDLQKAIQAPHEDGKAILFSTHIMSEAERLCDRIAIIDKGRIRACDDLEGLRAATSRHYLEDIFVHYVTANDTPGQGLARQGPGVPSRSPTFGARRRLSGVGSRQG